MYRNIVISTKFGSVRCQQQLLTKGQIRLKTRFAYPTGMKAYEDDYVETLEYPTPDYETRTYTAKQKKRLKEVLDWQTSIRNKNTVEEKLMEMNINRAYGWKSHILNEDMFHYNSLPFLKYITRTCAFTNSEYPNVYSSPEILDKVKHYSEILKKPLEEVIKFELYGVDRVKEETEVNSEFALKCNQSLANQISRMMLLAFGADEPKIKDIEVDYRPRSETFWMVGGFHHNSAKIIGMLEKKKKDKKETKYWFEDNNRCDITCQYIGTPLIQVRSKIPLAHFHNADFSVDNSVPLSEFDYRPGQFGYHRKLRTATNIPGYWTNDPAKSNWISFHSSHNLDIPGTIEGTPEELDKKKHPAFEAKKEDLRQAQAILSSFGKLLAQAYGLGFDQFTDLDYPLTTQTIVFNGIDWSFHSYQLNTIQLDNSNIKKNPKQNFCWTTPSMKILDENGTLNTNVLEMLLKFYLVPTLSKDLKFSTPYVKCDLENVKDDWKREFILFNFHEMYSLRRQDLFKMQIPEVYHWEWIYKIKHETRPMDARRKAYAVPGMSDYTSKYLFKEPRFRPKRLKFLEAELEEKKEKQRLDAATAALANQFKNLD